MRGQRLSVSLFVISMLILGVSPAGLALYSDAIEEVRNKTVLEAGYDGVIDDFLEEAVGELFTTEDFTVASKIRAVVAAKSVSNNDDYVKGFLDSAQKHLKKTLQSSEDITDAAVRMKVQVNLLILTDRLGAIKLMDLAAGYLESNNTAVRYWATHSITNERIAKQLNAFDNKSSVLVKKAYDLLSQRIEAENSAEILSLVVKFADNLRGETGEKLLVEAADRRTKEYAAWDVDYELLDSVLLKSLGQRIVKATKKAEMGKSFSQLYSYAMQRYIKGAYVLGEKQKVELKTVLVETERTCIGKILGIPQQRIRKLIERDELDELKVEHDRLLGNPDESGELVKMLGFSYGEQGGQKRGWPLELSEPEVEN